MATVVPGSPLTLEEVQANVARAAEAQRQTIINAPRPHRPGRRQTARTRERLSRRRFDNFRTAALADPNIHPLRRARLEFDGEGLTIDALSKRALVSSSLIEKAEAGRPVGALSRQRLARALGVEPAALTE